MYVQVLPQTFRNLTIQNNYLAEDLVSTNPFKIVPFASSLQYWLFKFYKILSNTLHTCTRPVYMCRTSKRLSCPPPQIYDMGSSILLHINFYKIVFI